MTTNMPDTHRGGPRKDRVFVKLPLASLLAGGLEYFLEHGLQPEICFEADQVNRLGPEHMEPLARALEQRSLRCTVHAPFMGLDFGAEEAQVLERAELALSQTLGFCRVLRPVSVVMHGGQPRYMSGREYESWNERALPVLQRAARQALDQGTRVMVENICHTRPRQLGALLEGLEGLAGWCLDVGHWHVFGREPVEEWIRELGPRLGQLHLHDNDGGSDQHLPVGRGSIDYARVFDCLADLLPNVPHPVTTLEVPYQNGVKPSLDALARVWPWQGAAVE